MGLHLEDQDLSFAPRGVDVFHRSVARLLLRIAAVAALLATLFVALVHLSWTRFVVGDWLFLLGALSVGVLSWREAKSTEPQVFPYLIGMLVLIFTRIVTAELFVAACLLVPMFVMALMAVFSLSESRLQVFNRIYFSATALAAASFVWRFGFSNAILRGLVGTLVGAAIGLVTLRMIRRENFRFMARYERLYEGVSIGLVRLSASGDVVTANQKLVELVGASSAAALTGTSLNSLFADAGESAGVVADLRNGVPREVKLSPRGGYPIWVRITLSPVVDSDGESLGYEGFFEDLSESKMAEASASNAEARFATVFDSAPIGMALVDAAGAVIRANRAFTALVDEPAFTPPGMPWSTLLDGQLGDPSRFFREAANSEMEVSVSHPKVGQRSFRLRASRPPGPAGPARYAIVQLLDVTSHVELEATLREQVRAKNDFIATVSHELRTPLTAVVGFVDELGAVLDDPSPDALEMIDIVAAEATSLSAIVEDLLVAASADIDRLAVVVEEVDVDAVIDRVVRASSRLVVEHGASLEVERCDDAIAVADPRRVEQILWNLVTNAVRHGGSAITIVGKRSGDRRIAIMVQDSGAGIPPGLSDEVFKPYSSFALDQGVTPSLGLGLYVAQKLARLMGGELSARSENGSSEFTLDLPAAHLAVVEESA